MLKGNVAIVTGSTSNIRHLIAKVSMIEHLNRKNAVHVGPSTGCGQATPYVAYHFIGGRTRFASLATRLAGIRGRRLIRSDCCSSRHDCPGGEGIGRL